MDNSLTHTQQGVVGVQINAFVPAEYVRLQGPIVNALGVPQVEFHLPPLQPGQAIGVSIPVLFCVSALNGVDHDPQVFIKVHDDRGEVRGRVEQMWIWEDVTNSPMKWRVFDQQVPFVVRDPGVFHFGVYLDNDHGPDQALSSFLLPVYLDAPPQAKPQLR